LKAEFHGSTTKFVTVKVTNYVVLTGSKIDVTYSVKVAEISNVAHAKDRKLLEPVNGWTEIAWTLPLNAGEPGHF